MKGSKTKIIIKTKRELRNLIVTKKGALRKRQPDLNKYDYSSITDMSGMFYYCRNIKTIPWLDTSNVTNMNNMFHDCHSLTVIPALDTSNVTMMNGMFRNCFSLKTIPLLNISKVNIDKTILIFEKCFIKTKEQIQFLYQKDKMIIKSIEMGIIKDDKMNELLKGKN
jgi:surface protein